jgi:hypothetical protein
MGYLGSKFRSEFKYGKALTLYKGYIFRKMSFKLVRKLVLMISNSGLNKDQKQGHTDQTWNNLISTLKRLHFQPASWKYVGNLFWWFLAQVWIWVWCQKLGHTVQSYIYINIWKIFYYNKLPKIYNGTTGDWTTCAWCTYS